MVDDIGVWLESLGLDQYIDAFADNKIGPDVLSDLTKDDLKELGVCIGELLTPSRHQGSDGRNQIESLGRPRSRHGCSELAGRGLSQVGLNRCFRIYNSFGREPDGDRRTDALRTLQVKGTAVHFNEMFGQRQP